MEWMYDKQTGIWTGTVDGWRAIVLQAINTSSSFALIERTIPPYQQYQSGHFDTADQARTWCETELAKYLSREERK